MSDVNIDQFSQDPQHSKSYIEQQFQVLQEQVNNCLVDEKPFDASTEQDIVFLKLLYDFLYDMYQQSVKENVSESGDQINSMLAVMSHLFQLAIEAQESDLDDNSITEYMSSCKASLEEAGWLESFNDFSLKQHIATRKEFIGKLSDLISYVEVNKAAKKALGDEFSDIKQYFRQIQEDINTGDLDEATLLEQIKRIDALVNKILTPEIEYQYELEQLSIVMQEQGYGSFFARLLANNTLQKPKEILHQVDSVASQRKVDKRQLASVLRATREHLENPSADSLSKLNECVADLPEKSSARFYLTAMILTIVAGALIFGLVAACIHYPQANELIKPLYTSCANFFANIVSSVPSFPTMVATVVTPVQGAAMQTAFVMPHASPYAAGEAVPVWSLVAGGVAGGVLGIGGTKIIDKTVALRKAKQGYEPVATSDDMSDNELRPDILQLDSSSDSDSDSDFGTEDSDELTFNTSFSDAVQTLFKIGDNRGASSNLTTSNLRQHDASVRSSLGTNPQSIFHSQQAHKLSPDVSEDENADNASVDSKAPTVRR